MKYFQSKWYHFIFSPVVYESSGYHTLLLRLHFLFIVTILEGVCVVSAENRSGVIVVCTVHQLFLALKFTR